MSQFLLSALDIETTGLEQAAGHRIIEIAILHFDFQTRQLVDEFVQRIDPQRPIDADAQNVHGIAYDDLVGCPTWETVAPRVSAELQRSGVMIAHNMDFDGPFIAQELIRVGQPIPSADAYCTMANGRWACFDGKFPKLEELCFALGVPYDRAEAHAARYDVMRMMDCYFKGLDRGFFQAPIVSN